jgi:hypothetical protein
MTPTPERHPDESAHAWGVRLVIDGWRKTFVPWCECGWVGQAFADGDSRGAEVKRTKPPDRRAEQQAAAVAFTHATGHPPEPVERHIRLRGPRQAEVLFDREKYNR